jgi:hypothetical protein
MAGNDLLRNILAQLGDACFACFVAWRCVQITLSQAVDVLTQVARGLRHLHGGGVFHRDLAARNVLVKGRVFKVTDFGLSSVASDVDGARMTYTTIGPVAWRAPETFHVDDKKRQIASVATDVYMLGGLMFEVLTAGRHAPFFWMPGESLTILRGSSTRNTLDAAKDARVPIPWAVVPDDDWIGADDGVARLKTLMALCLQSEPSLRPSTDHFLAQLDAIRNPSLVCDAGYRDGSAAAVAPLAPASTRGGAATYSTSAMLPVSAAAPPPVTPAPVPAPSNGAAAQPADVVDMSAALAAMEALQIAADVSDRVCEEMVASAAEVGHVTGARFLQIVVDEGTKAALAMKLRERLRITSVVPRRRVRGDCVVILLR